MTFCYEGGNIFSFPKAHCSSVGSAVMLYCSRVVDEVEKILEGETKTGCTCPQSNGAEVTSLSKCIVLVRFHPPTREINRL